MRGTYHHFDMESMYTVINDVFQLFLSYQVFEIQCVLYTYSSSELKLATFQVLSNHMWLMTIILNSTDVEHLSDSGNIWDVPVVAQKMWSALL